MNSKQLFEALNSNKVTEPFFDGIYACDQLDDIIIKPQLIIVNTQPSDMSGEHWLAFFCESNTVDVFDSLARNLNGYSFAGKHLTDFVRRNSTFMKGVKVRIQPVNSDICGEMCLYFAYFRCLGYSLEFILDKMKGNVDSVLEFIARTFTSSKTKEKCKFTQRCRKQK